VAGWYAKSARVTTRNLRLAKRLFNQYRPLSDLFKWLIASLVRYSPQVISTERAFKMIEFSDIEIPRSEQNHSIRQLFRLDCLYYVPTERKIPD
jgi:hypothetical protein